MDLLNLSSVLLFRSDRRCTGAGHGWDRSETEVGHRGGTVRWGRERLDRGGRGRTEVGQRWDKSGEGHYSHAHDISCISDAQAL
eukprot:1392139-Amorphochlora_amoeboformis.AAC.1